MTTRYQVGVADLKWLRNSVKDNWALCEFMAHGSRASEAEYMVAQTIHACAINLEKRGLPISFRGDGVFSTGGNGLVNNGFGYWRLIDEGLIEEEVVEASRFQPLPEGIEPDSAGKVTVIHMTEKLVERLKAFLSKEKR